MTGAGDVQRILVVLEEGEVHLYRDDRLVTFSDGKPIKYRSFEDALFVAAHWEDYQKAQAALWVDVTQ